MLQLHVFYFKASFCVFLLPESKETLYKVPVPIFYKVYKAVGSGSALWKTAGSGSAKNERGSTALEFLEKNLILCRKYPCKRQICLREVVDCVADVSQVAGQVGQAVPVPVSPQLWLAAGIFLKVLAVQWPAWGETNSPGFYHFCARQFMLFSHFWFHSLFFSWFIYSILPWCGYP